MSATLQETLSEISPMLCKFAAHHTGTHYSPTVDGLAMEAQDLYQHAVTEILRTCKDGDSKSFMLTKADWRMSNRCTSERKVYYEKIGLESDLQRETSDDDDDGDTILDIIAVDHSNPEEVLIEREMGMAISAAMRNLKPEWAVIVKLMSDGYSLTEVAAKIGISYEAAWKRIVKIRETFQLAGLSPAALAMA